MKPPAFDLALPGDVDEVLDLLHRHGEDARILAGGQSLMTVLNMRLAKPALLIDITRLDALRTLERDSDAVRIGAATTQATVERWAETAVLLPLVARALPLVGHFQTRNQGTICGNIAHADPASELPLCLTLLRGSVELRSRRGIRTVPAERFLQGLLSTDRAADEMVSAVRFPVAAPGTAYAFREMAIRHGDFALTAVAVAASASGLRIAVGGVADRPVARDLPRLTGDALEDALNDLAWDLDAQGDVHASAAYRRHLTRTLGRAAIEEALSCLS